MRNPTAIMVTGDSPLRAAIDIGEFDLYVLGIDSHLPQYLFDSAHLVSLSPTQISEVIEQINMKSSGELIAWYDTSEMGKASQLLEVLPIVELQLADLRIHESLVELHLQKKVSPDIAGSENHISAESLDSETVAHVFKQLKLTNFGSECEHCENESSQLIPSLKAQLLRSAVSKAKPLKRMLPKKAVILIYKLLEKIR